MWGFFYDYGRAQEIRGSAGDIDTTSAGGRWSHLWSRRGQGPLSGHPAFALEVLPLTVFFQDPATVAVGFNLLYEHHFTATGRVLPIWRIGVGALHASRPVPGSGTQTNFSLLTGLALNCLVTERGAFEVEYRFHHVSNADTGFRNPEINAHTLLISCTIYR